ncbi:MAG: hypothetical protein ACREQM_14330 [Candidatus Dormibacteraceae bacterium]
MAVPPIPSPALFWCLVVLALVVNAAALALPSRSIASLAVGVGAALVTYVAAALVSPSLDLLPAVVVAVLAAREWGYRWCLVSLPAVALAYLAFDVVRSPRWPLVALTLLAYAILVACQVWRRRRALDR